MYLQTTGLLALDRPKESFKVAAGAIIYGVVLLKLDRGIHDEGTAGNPVISVMVSWMCNNAKDVRVQRLTIFFASLLSLR